MLGDLAHGVEVVERHAHEALHERLEAGLHLAAAGGGERGERAAMEGLLHDDDRRLGDVAVVAVLARDLDRGFRRLEARVAEEHLVEAGDLGDAVGRGLLVRNAPQVRGMDDPAPDPLRQGPGQPGMRIAESVYRDAGERVEVLLALLVPEPDAFAAHEGDRLAGVGVHDVGHAALPENAKYECQWLKCKTAARAAVS